MDDYRRGVPSCLVVPALSTRDVSLISSTPNGGYCALAESATCFAEHGTA